MPNKERYGITTKSTRHIVSNTALTREQSIHCDSIKRDRIRCPFHEKPDTINYITATCLCQYCMDPCYEGLNCHECNVTGKPAHHVYMCTKFTGVYPWSYSDISPELYRKIQAGAITDVEQCNSDGKITPIESKCVDITIRHVKELGGINLCPHVT